MKLKAEDEESTPTPVSSDSNIFYKVSTAYQHIAALYRKENHLTLAVASMRRSVSSLTDRPSEELVTANLGGKLDRLASYYHILGDDGRACENLVLAFEAWSIVGAFGRLGEGYTNLEVFDVRAGDFALIARSLALYVKCLTSVSGQSSFWDSPSLDVNSRGLILEWQIKTALSLSTTESRRLAHHGIEHLLTIYSSDHPIRRARYVAGDNLFVHH